MTNEMQHFIQEAIDRIADGIRGQWTVRDEAFLKNIISDGLQPLRVEIENFEAIERERDLLKDDQATITTLRERLAAAEAMLNYATGFEIDDVFICRETDGDNRWYAWKTCTLEDVSEDGFETFDEVYQAVKSAGWFKPQPQESHQ